MFTNDTSDTNRRIVNAIQESPGRLSIYSINRCEDQVIGFEFVSRQYESSPHCCGSTIVNLCVPIEVLSPIQFNTAEFLAGDDGCYKEWIISKTEEPDVEIQRDTDNKVTGVLVRFSRHDTCCYPINMAFKLRGIDVNGCNILLSSGLLIFR